MKNLLIQKRLSHDSFIYGFAGVNIGKIFFYCKLFFSLVAKKILLIKNL